MDNKKTFNVKSKILNSFIINIYYVNFGRKLSFSEVRNKYVVVKSQIFYYGKIQTNLHKQNTG
jgi:hypothetical protein